ncbi:MAG TPA: hypothetical protein VI321_08380 [Burkholderiales bacterium]
MIVYTPPRAAASIPLIDPGSGFSASREERHKVAWEIHEACREKSRYAACTAAEHVYEMFKRSYGYSPTEVKRGIHT